MDLNTNDVVTRMVKMIIIDYDNTLHDSDSKFIAEFDGILGLSGRELWELYLNKIHREIIHKLYPERHEDVKFHSRLIFKYLKKPYDENVAKQITEGYKVAIENCWKKPTFFPDTFVFLNTVKEKGYNICLSSGEHVMEKAQCLERVGSKRYFDFSFEEDILGYLKTDPNYYKRILELTNSVPKETLSIGDALNQDIIPAKTLGIKTIWVNRRNYRVPEKFQRPDYEVKELLEALNYL